MLLTAATPTEAVATGVEWTSSNRGVATVTDGTVTAVGEGTATITAVVGGMGAECYITVGEQGSTSANISLGIGLLEMEPGTEEKISYTLPENFSRTPELRWESSDEEVATVNQEGVVKAVDEGTAIISLLLGKEVAAACQVTVGMPLASSDESSSELEAEPPEPGAQELDTNASDTKIPLAAPVTSKKSGSFLPFLLLGMVAVAGGAFLTLTLLRRRNWRLAEGAYAANGKAALTEENPGAAGAPGMGAGDTHVFSPEDVNTRLAGGGTGSGLFDGITGTATANAATNTFGLPVELLEVEKTVDPQDSFLDLPRPSSSERIHLLWHEDPPESKSKQKNDATVEIATGLGAWREAAAETAPTAGEPEVVEDEPDEPGDKKPEEPETEAVEEPVAAKPMLRVAEPRKPLKAKPSKKAKKATVKMPAPATEEEPQPEPVEAEKKEENIPAAGGEVAKPNGTASTFLEELFFIREKIGIREGIDSSDVVSLEALLQLEAQRPRSYEDLMFLSDVSDEDKLKLKRFADDFQEVLPLGAYLD